MNLGAYFARAKFLSEHEINSELLQSQTEAVAKAIIERNKKAEYLPIGINTIFYLSLTENEKLTLTEYHTSKTVFEYIPAMFGVMAYKSFFTYVKLDDFIFRVGITRSSLFDTSTGKIKLNMGHTIAGDIRLIQNNYTGDLEDIDNEPNICCDAENIIAFKIKSLGILSFSTNTNDYNHECRLVALLHGLILLAELQPKAITFYKGRVSSYMEIQLGYHKYDDGSLTEEETKAISKNNEPWSHYIKAGSLARLFAQQGFIEYALLQQVETRVKNDDFIYSDVTVPSGALTNSGALERLVAILELRKEPLAYLCCALLLTSEIPCYYNNDLGVEDAEEYLIKRITDGINFYKLAAEDPSLKPMCRSVLSLYKRGLKEQIGISDRFKDFVQHVFKFCNYIDVAPVLVPSWELFKREPLEIVVYNPQRNSMKPELKTCLRS